jgi:hypothetical protein
MGDFLAVTFVCVFAYAMAGFFVSVAYDVLVHDSGLSKMEWVAAWILWPVVILRGIYWLVTAPLKSLSGANGRPLALAMLRLATFRKVGS